MSFSKLFDVYFGPINTLVSNSNNKYNVSMTVNGKTVFSKLYPNGHSSSSSIPGLPFGYKINEVSNPSLTTFNFFFNNQKHAEIGINHVSNRVSLISDPFTIFPPIPPTPPCPCPHPIPPCPCPHPIPPCPCPHPCPPVPPVPSSVTFVNTGFDQSYVVPSNAKYVIAQCWGAGGASQGSGSAPMYNTGNGGGGGYTKSKIINIAGKTLNIIVGEGGSTVNNGGNANDTYGGGGGQMLNGDTNYGSASGGGRSAVQLMIGGVFSDIVTAGGGGAAGGNNISGSSDYFNMGSGGAGGGSIGGNAENNSSVSVMYGGTGGTQTTGGTNGTSVTGSTANAHNGGQYIGGGNNQYGGGAGSGFEGGGYGGIVYFNGFTPTPVPVSGSILWLDASVANSVKISNGVVTEWDDQSGFGINAVPFVGNCTYSSTAQSGLPGISMEGTALYAPLPAGTFNNGVTWFVVLSNLADQSFNTIITRTDATVGGLPGPWDIYNNSLLVGNNSWNTTNMAPNDLSIPFGPTLATFQSSSSTPESITIGSTNYKSATSEPFYLDTGDHIYIGTRGDKVTGFGGVISEILVYDSILTPDQITQTQNYLNTKWNLSTLSSIFYNGSGNPLLVQALVNGQIPIINGVNLAPVSIPYTNTTPLNAGIVPVAGLASQITYSVSINGRPTVIVPYDTSVYPYGYTVGASSTQIFVSPYAGTPTPTGFVFGGAGGGSSFVDKNYATSLSMLQASGPTVAGMNNLPSSVMGSVGGGAVATNNLNGGQDGQNGYIILEVVV
jgi:hypothetical protein